jgi:molybdopterin-guanine dinucleotide biosynthesis protein A
MTVPGYAAMVLAGGAARRLGGVAKAALEVGGRSLLERVLAAVPDARPRIVIGPAQLAAGLPVDVAITSEEPPGGGPVAAAAAGLSLLPPGIGFVALLAADLPFLTRAAVSDLRRVAAAPTLDGALFIDSAGRRQLLCAVWRTSSLTSRIGALRVERGRLGGVPLRDLVGGLRIGQIPAYRRPGADSGPPPWFDCDTEADLTSAERWVDEHPG